MLPNFNGVVSCLVLSAVEVVLAQMASTEVVVEG